MTQALSELQLKALVFLGQNTSEEFVAFSRSFADEQNISLYRARKTMRELRDMGYARLVTGLVDEDTWQLAGSGYGITEAGSARIGEEFPE